MTTSTKRPDGGELNSEIVRLIDELRRDEGDSVTFISDNPDFNGQPNCAIVCNGDWTGYEDRRFAADTILDALSSAATERKLPTARQVIAESNGHHWVQRFNLVCCRDCGIVRRADDKNSPCKGIVTVELRSPTNESPAPQATKKTYIKPLRAIVEIDERYADQIRDLLNVPAPQPPVEGLREALEACEYCGPGKHSGLPGGACENCMNTGLKSPAGENTDWDDISTRPDSNDLMWFSRGDTYDGPREPRFDDADYWDHWCYAKPPSLTALASPSLTAGPSEQGINDQDEVLLAYGLLWCVNTTDQRVHSARRELLKCLNKDLQAKAISAAHTTLALVRDIRQMKGATFAHDFVAEPVGYLYRTEGPVGGINYFSVNRCNEYMRNDPWMETPLYAAPATLTEQPSEAPAPAPSVREAFKCRKHYFTPSDADRDFCARCGNNFRNLDFHCSGNERPETDFEYISRLEVALSSPHAVAGDVYNPAMVAEILAADAAPVEATITSIEELDALSVSPVTREDVARKVCDGMSNGNIQLEDAGETLRFDCLSTANAILSLLNGTVRP